MLICLKTDQHYSNNSNSKEWLDFTSNFQLIQLIKEPTRVTATTATLIDHFFTTHPDKVRAVKVAKIGLSDHYPICAVFKSSFGSKYCHTSITYRSYLTIRLRGRIDYESIAREAVGRMGYSNS